MSIEIKATGTVKPKTSRMHAIKRAYERYGMDMSEQEVERIELNIRMRNDAFFLYRQSKTRSAWLVKLDDKLAVAIYNRNQKCLSTLLPVWYAKRFFSETGEQEVPTDKLPFLVKRIRNHDQVFFFERKKKNVQVWLGRVDGKLVVCLYNPSQKKIFQILPHWYAKKYLNGESEFDEKKGRYSGHY